MIRCPNNECGFENQDGSKFCAGCGAKLEVKMHCAECGAELLAGAKFCSSCGTVVNANVAKIENGDTVHPTQQPAQKQTADIETDISNLPRANASFYEYFDRFRGNIPILASIDNDNPVMWHTEGCYGNFFNDAKMGYLGEFKRDINGYCRWIEYFGVFPREYTGQYSRYTDDKWEYDGDYFDKANNVVKKGRISAIIDSCKTTPIFALIDTDNIEAVKQYIKTNSSAITSEAPISPLLAVAMTGSVAMAKVLIGAGADVNAVSREFKGRTPLMIAASRGDTAMLKFLLDNGAMDFVPCEEGCLPLHYAACSDDVADCLEMLLSRKTVDVNVKNSVGETALDLAMEHDAVKCIELLKNAGASVFDEERLKEKKTEQVRLDKDKRTEELVYGVIPKYHHYAKEEEEEEKVEVYPLDGNAKVKELLAQGVQIDTVGCVHEYSVRSGRGSMLSGLGWCGEEVKMTWVLCDLLPEICNDAEILKLLIDNGVNLKELLANETDVLRDVGRSHDVLLERTQNPEIIRICLENGADIDVDSYYVWDMAKNFEICKMLVERGAEINRYAFDKALEKNDMAWSKWLIEHAADVSDWLWSVDDIESVEIAQLLIDKGADVNYKPEYRSDQRPLYIVKNVQVALLLIDNGADVNVSADEGFTPLHYAVNHNSPEIVQLFIDKGADVNAQSSDGVSPLHSATDDSNIEIVKLLIAHGANVNEKMTQKAGGFTPLHIAVNRNNFEIVKLLVEKGAKIDIKDARGRTPLNYECSDEIIAFLQANKGNNGGIFSKLFG